jgi:8-oxo-dGTP diphosphatase
MIEAAGGVLWRPGHDDVEVALVHRPKYDDWSIPKGKLKAGEPALDAALREVQEETGHTAEPGRPLGEIRYLKDGAPKRVRYWAMRVTGGRFTASDEVDALLWLTPREARLRVDPERGEARILEVDLDTLSAPARLRSGNAGQLDPDR